MRGPCPSIKVVTVEKQPRVRVYVPGQLRRPGKYVFRLKWITFFVDPSHVLTLKYLPATPASHKWRFRMKTYLANI
jgi:hypothetical protein